MDVIDSEWFCLREHSEELVYRRTEFLEVNIQRMLASSVDVDLLGEREVGTETVSRTDVHDTVHDLGTVPSGLFLVELVTRYP